MRATFREHILSEEEETSIEDALLQLGATFANMDCKYFLISADVSVWRTGGELNCCVAALWCLDYGQLV